MSKDLTNFLGKKIDWTEKVETAVEKDFVMEDGDKNTERRKEAVE